MTRKHQVDDLSALYELSDREIRDLNNLAKEGGKRGWWEPFKEGAPPEVRKFVESEQIALKIRSVELEHIPGLLQTDAYLQAVQAVLPHLSPEVLKAVRQLRATRQELVFTGDHRPELELVIGRAAIEYLDDLGEAGREQLERIHHVAAMPGVDIRILHGLHPAMQGSFTILTPGPPMPGEPFVFLDAIDGCRYVETRDVVSLYERTHHAARDMATPIEENVT